MSNCFHIVPESLVIGFSGDKDARILYIDYNSLAFESTDIIESNISFKLAFFNFRHYDYEEFYLEDCKITNCEKKQYSYIYTVEIAVCKDYQNLQQRIDDLSMLYNPKIKKFKLTNDTDYFDFISENHRVYPKIKDKDFCESYEKQKELWYNYNFSDQDHERFSNLVSDVELSFSIDSMDLYTKFIDFDFSKAIHLILEERKLSDHGVFLKPFSRVYIGNQFCHNLFPDELMLFELLNKAYKENYNVTLSFTYLRDCLVEKQIDLLNKIDMWMKDHMCLEVVINDWGLAQILIEKFPKFKPVLGVLLNKRKKDPRISYKFGMDRFKKQREENNLNCEHYTNYLNTLGIYRYEYELYDGKNSVVQGKHSLHFPFYQLNTSSYCPLYAECVNLNSLHQVLVKNCPKYCSEYVYIYPTHTNMIGKGNSVFGYNNTILTNPDLLGEYIKAGIDRLVYSI